MQSARTPAPQPLRTLAPTRSRQPAPRASQAFLAAWAAYVLLSGVDCLTTAWALGNHLTEINPLAARLYASGGITALWAFKFAVLGMMLPLLTLLPRRIAVAVAVGLAAVMCLNDISNLSWILAPHG